MAWQYLSNKVYEQVLICSNFLIDLSIIYSLKFYCNSKSIFVATESLHQTMTKNFNRDQLTFCWQFMGLSYILVIVWMVVLAALVLVTLLYTMAWLQCDSIPENQCIDYNQFGEDQ